MHDPAEIFEDQRQLLFGLAYRLLGSTADAEDIMQEAYIRWSGVDTTAVKNPTAWLIRAVTNLSLNRLASAHTRRERYVGTWLPEPILTADGTLGPMETSELRNSVSLALLMLMERLTPAERAVFVIRESFGYSHREIAEALGLSEANCRQLHRRAHLSVQQPQNRFRPTAQEWRRLVERFLRAAMTGDLAGLEALLADDVTYWGDGGGNAPVAKRPVSGRNRVARFFVKAFAHYNGILASPSRVEIFAAEVNGELGVLVGDGEAALLAVLMPEIAMGQIITLRILANPEKLTFIAGQAEALSHPKRLSGRLLIEETG